MELVAARARHGVDDTTGAAAELRRIAAGLDLELFVERERHRRIPLATVGVGDVQAVDVDPVLGHGRTTERESADGGARSHPARPQPRTRPQALVNPPPRAPL